MKKLSATDSPEVMVCVLKSQRDRKILLDEKWYRVPLFYAPRRRPKYLAFYQPALFGSSGKRIELYGLLKCWHVKKRIELLPREINHPNAQEPYIQFIFSKVNKLAHPLVNRSGLRVSFGFTSLSKLHHASDLGGLFGLLPMENILAKILEEDDITFYRQYTVKAMGKKIFRLDFALPGFGKWIDLECDASRWHSRKEQRERDKQRDRMLKELGWAVLRVTEEDLTRNPAKLLKKIKMLKTRS